jgi:hypothetical protein
VVCAHSVVLGGCFLVRVFLFRDPDPSMPCSEHTCNQDSDTSMLTDTGASSSSMAHTFRVQGGGFRGIGSSGCSCLDDGRFGSQGLRCLGFAGLDVGKRCTSQVWRWGGGGVLDCLRMSLLRWLLVRGARFWWIPSWVVAGAQSRSSSMNVILPFKKLLAHIQSMALRHIVRTASTDMQTHAESQPHRRTYTHENIERYGRRHEKV